MTSRKAAVYGVGAGLLVTYLASANMPTQEPLSRERVARPTGTSGAESVAVDVQAQAAKLHARMAQAPVPAQSLRNPFSFGMSRAARTPSAAAMFGNAGTVHAAVASDAPSTPFTAPLPVLTLMGVAEESAGNAVRRTAVVGGDRDTVYMVVEGQPVGDRYRVTKIGADAVELEDLLTHGYRRIAMR
jgi:Tfp pilus assembly protein PilP